jgi:hypothetical protein
MKIVFYDGIYSMRAIHHVKRCGFGENCIMGYIPCQLSMEKLVS